MAGETRNVVVRLSAEVAGAVAGINRVGDTAEKTAGRLERSGVRGQKALDATSKASRNVALAGAAGLAVIERASYKFDKQMSSVDAATHETAKNMGLLRKAAIEAGADTQFSATEAAQGITELAKAGISTKAVLKGGLKGALDLAAAGQLSVAESAETAASAMTQFRLKGKDVPHIADLLAAGAGKAQGSVHDMGQALNQSGLIASQTGLSIEETTGALGAFASAGLVGSDAGTSFKTMLMSLNPRTENAAAWMDKFNISAYDAQGNFIGLEKYAGRLRKGLKDLTTEQRADVLHDIFGTDAIRAANILYRNGEKGIARWIDKVNDSGYAAETAARQTDNLAGDVERFTGSLETAFINGGSGAQDGLRDLVQSAEDVVDAFNDLPAAVQSNVVKAVAGVTIAAAGIYGITKAIRGVQAVKSILPGKGAAAAAGLAQSAGVQKVFVVNPGFGAGGAGGAKAVPVGAAPAAAAGAGATAAKAGRLAKLGAGARVVGVAALATYAASVINEQIQGALRKVGDRGNLGGSLSQFKREKTGLNSALFGSGNTIQHDAKLASAQGGFGGVPSKIEKLGGSLIPGGTSYTQAIKNFEKLDTTLAKLNFEDPTKAAGVYAKVLKESGLSTSELNKALPKTADAVKSLSDKTDNGAASFKTAYQALSTTTPTLGKYAKTLNTIPKNIRSYVSTPGAALSVASMRGLQKQYNLTPRQVRTIMQLQGFSKTQAEIVVAGRAYRNLPKAVKTAISTPGAIKSEADVKKLQRRYNLTPAQKNTVMRVSGVDAAIAKTRQLQREIAAVRSKSVTIETVIRRRNSGNGANLPVPKADGGQVVAGAGQSRGARDDSIDARLSHREFVQPVAAVDYYGEGFMEAIRTRSLRKPIGFADGGLVGGTSYVSARSTGAGSVSVIFPTPAVLKASVRAAEQVAVQSALTARSAADTRKAKLEDLQAQIRIRDLTRDLKKLRGADRAAAAAELAVARDELTALRHSVTTEARAALAEARSTAASSLRDGLAFKSAPTSGIKSVERRISEVTTYGDTLARLKAAGASPGLLAYVKAQGDTGDLAGATRLGKALLNQPGTISQFSTALATLDSVSSNVATLTTDPRFMSSAAWNPGNTVVRQVAVQLGVDPSTWMTELVARTTHAVVAQMAGV